MIAVILAKKILSLYLILIMGIILVRTRLLKASDSKILSVIMMYVIQPCVIISSFQIEYTPEIRNGLLLAGAAGLLIHILLLGTAAVFGKFLHWDPVEKCSILYSNAANLIIPIVIALLGSEYVIYTSAFVCIQLCLLWSHAKMVLCGEKSIDLKKILTNVNMISIMIGMLLFVFRIQLPGIISDSFDTVSAMIGPSAMLVTGMLIGNMNLSKLLSYRRLPMAVLFRLIIYPVMIIIMLKLSGLEHLVNNGHTILMISILAAITPPANTITQMAQIFDKDADYASAINVAATLLCIISMPLMLMIYEM